MNITFINSKINIKEIWKNAINCLKVNNIEVQSIKARIIDLTESVDWKLILKMSDHYDLIKKIIPKFLKGNISNEVNNKNNKIIKLIIIRV